MKKNLYYIIISFLILPLVVFSKANVVNALVTCNIAGCPNPIALGEDVKMTVTAKDEIGYPITGVSIEFTWTAPAGLGFFTQVDGIAKTGQSVTSTPTVKDGTSTAVLKIPFSSTGGTVTVTAAYAGVTATTNFNINVFCNSDPKLYYAIGGVRDNGDDNWQYSTAELLETCRTEYKLYGGAGGRY